MSRSTDLQTRVIDVIRRQLHATRLELAGSMRFVDSLGADSLALVDLTLALEEEFDINIEDDHIEAIRTVRDAIQYVALHLEAPPRV